MPSIYERRVQTMELTKESKKVLLKLYKEYLERMQSGVSRDKAKAFDPDIIGQTLFQEYSSSNFNDYLCELGSNEYLDNFYGSGIVQYTSLTNLAISEMENRFKNGILDVADFISKFV